jgi:protein-L-isoaspartate(D-aspartate) O-methyltransferase
MKDDFEIRRAKMIDLQLRARGIKSQAVLDVMRSVPRHLFVPENMREFAYDDCPLPIGLGQTISQPYIVAYMTEQLLGACGSGMNVQRTKVLEIGTGSGYQAAVLASLGCLVLTMELLEEHAVRAKEVFTRLGYGNINVKCGNGHAGWPEEAPFDAIIVTAAPEKLPPVLFEQLKDGGRILIPVGKADSVQSLRLIVKNGKNMIQEELLLVRFVPMR